LGRYVGPVVTSSQKRTVNLAFVGEIGVARQLIKPNVLHEAVVVLFKRFINGFIVITAFIVTEDGQDHRCGEVFLELGKGGSKICFNRLVVLIVWIITHGAGCDLVATDLPGTSITSTALKEPMNLLKV
jgi:hypothetical protein